MKRPAGVTSISEIRPATPQEWDATWCACDYATYFHSRAWAEVWERYTRGQLAPAPLHCRFRDGTSVLLPMSRRTGRGGLIATYESSPGGTFGGFLSSDPLTARHAAGLSHELARRWPNLVLRRNPYSPVQFPVDVGTEDGDVTHALDLRKGFDTLRAGWTKGHRSAARKARREGVTITTADTWSAWERYLAVYEASLTRWGTRATSRHGRDLFAMLWDRRSQDVVLWLAKRDGTTVAGALCLYAGRHAAYWHGAALEEYFPLRPVHLLLQECIRDACRRGLTWFDFNPSGGHEGVVAFKKGFGAVPLPCPVVRAQSTAMRVITGAVGSWRAAWARCGVR